jgi:hypothetical protein
MPAAPVQQQATLSSAEPQHRASSLCPQSLAEMAPLEREAGIQDHEPESACAIGRVQHRASQRHHRSLRPLLDKAAASAHWEVYGFITRQVWEICLSLTSTNGALFRRPTDADDAACPRLPHPQPASRARETVGSARDFDLQLPAAFAPGLYFGEGAVQIDENSVPCSDRPDLANFLRIRARNLRAFPAESCPRPRNLHDVIRAEGELLHVLETIKAIDVASPQPPLIINDRGRNGRSAQLFELDLPGEGRRRQDGCRQRQEAQSLRTQCPHSSLPHGDGLAKRWLHHSRYAARPTRRNGAPGR